MKAINNFMKFCRIIKKKIQWNTAVTFCRNKFSSLRCFWLFMSSHIYINLVRVFVMELPLSSWADFDDFCGCFDGHKINNWNR